MKVSPDMHGINAEKKNINREGLQGIKARTMGAALSRYVQELEGTG
jgi:hypothetical protein